MNETDTDVLGTSILEHSFIYRPSSYYEGVPCFYGWHEEPISDADWRSVGKKIGIDPLFPRKLVEQDVDFISRHALVAYMPEHEIGDTMGRFDQCEMVVSLRFAQVIKEMDGNAHDIVRIRSAWSEQDKKRLNTDWFFVNVYRKVNTVDTDRAIIHRGKRGSDGAPFTMLMAIAESGSKVYPDITSDTHVWRDEVTNAIFMSQAIVDRLNQLDLKGVDFLRCSS